MTPVFTNLPGFLRAAGERDFAREGTLLFLARHGASVFNKLHDVFYDSLDSPLIEEGRGSARRLGRVLSGFPVRASYASPIPRAQESAWVANAKFATPGEVRVLDGLAEISLGLLDARPHGMNAAAYDAFLRRMRNPAERLAFAKSHGLTAAETDHAFGRALVRLKSLRDYCEANGVSEDEAVRQAALALPRLGFRAPLGGTSFEDIGIQALGIREFLKSEESRTGAVAMFAHGMVNRVLILTLLGLPLLSREQLSRIHQAEGCVNVLWREEGAEEWRLLVLNGEV